MKDYAIYLWRCIRQGFIGSRFYFTWMTVLAMVALVGLNAYARQLAHGLTVTDLSDHVCWGLYIANFGYMEGIAAASVMLVIPVYLYKDESLERVIYFGQILAVTCILMALMFVMADIGHPDRFWHMMPIIGKFQFPMSMLTWDVVVLNGYLLLMAWTSGYSIYCVYREEKPTPLFYLPVTFISIGWAVSMLTATSFLYVGLGGRPFWNSAIVAARFQTSAFAAGSAFIILSLQFVRLFTPKGEELGIDSRALNRLRGVIQVAMIFNMFLMFCELFKEFYTNSVHAEAVRYLMFGIEGQITLVPFFWTSVVLQVGALSILLSTSSKTNQWHLGLACGACALGIWIDKGMCMIVPAFTPSSLGELIEYFPTMTEWLISLGIAAFGLMLYTFFLKMTIPVLTGQLREPRPAADSQLVEGGAAQQS